jgi:hypothetical protein
MKINTCKVALDQATELRLAFHNHVHGTHSEALAAVSPEEFPANAPP